MDDNAQTKPVQASPTGSNFPGQNQFGNLPLAGNQLTQANGSQQKPSNQQSTVLSMQQILQQNDQNKKTTQQVSISGRPEQGSMATAEADDDDDKDDRVQTVKQEVAKKETPTPVVQVAHPEIEIQKELSKIGVTLGQDAVRKDIPEDPEQLGDILQQNEQQEAIAKTDEADLPMTYGEATLAAKKERSIRNGISWVIRKIIREWKKRRYAIYT